jgi:hypothetical protein
MSEWCGDKLGRLISDWPVIDTNRDVRRSFATAGS